MTTTAQRLVVIGANSGIAKIVVPTLCEGRKEIIHLTRSETSPAYSEFGSDKVDVRRVVMNFSDRDESWRSQLKSLFQSQFKTTVLNFAAVLGQPISWTNSDVEACMRVMQANVAPQLAIWQEARSLPQGSILIGFSGAGFGGSRVEIASIGYALAKAAIGGIVETVDWHLSAVGVRTCLIAPGAFPTRMQESVAKAADAFVQEHFSESARTALSSPFQEKKLRDLIAYCETYPERVGGRILSAKWDDLESLAKSGSDFGRVRRMH